MTSEMALPQERATQPIGPRREFCGALAPLPEGLVGTVIVARGSSDQTAGLSKVAVT